MPSYNQRCDLVGSLLGKKLLSVQLDQKKEILTFTTDKGDVTWETMGDCCSRSWVETVDIPQGVVQEVTSLGLPDNFPMEGCSPSEGPDFDVVRYYGIRVVTSSGHGLIDFRNDSNGYYGGEMEVRSCESWEDHEPESH